MTPTSCPPLPLYDIKVGTAEDGGREDPDQNAAIEAAENAGCLSPIGTARSGELPSSGNTGNAGAGGGG